MPTTVRRVVTGYDGKGELVVTSDEVLPIASKTPGGEAALLWTLPTTPVPLDDDGRHDGFGAARWYLVNVPPDEDRSAAAGDFPAGIPHENDAIDLIVVLSGEVCLELDGVKDWVRLKAGDTLVQRATKHGWRNDSGAPASFAALIVPGRRTAKTPSRLRPEDADFSIPSDH